MIAFLIRKSAAVFTFALLIVVAGIGAYLALPRESMPQIEQPYIFVTTAYPGVSASDIEQLVTQPLEEEIDGIDDIDKITSTSSQSFSFITVEFSSGVSVDEALRKVREQVDAVRNELPSEADDPVVTELSTSAWPILIVVFSHPSELQVINDNAEQIQDELEAVPGVLEVTIEGNRQKEVAIELDPVKLQYYGLSIPDVIADIQAEHVTIPGGFLETPLKKYNLSVSGEIKNEHHFNDIMIGSDEVSIPLSALGRARYTWEEPQSYSRLDGVPALSFAVSKRSGENIITVVDKVKARVDSLKTSLPPDTKITYVQDQSQRVRDMVLDLENNIFTGLILVLLVTLFFLGRVNALFVSLAIPFSMLFSFIVLLLFDITLNMVVLFSLVMALGMLVDNAIVVVENIYRHATEGVSRKQAAIDGTQEVALPIIASTITTFLAFIPILFMPDIIGDFMAFVPKTVIIVLSGSLMTALVILPVICAHYLRVSEKNRQLMSQGGSWFVRLTGWYEKRIITAIRYPGLTVLFIFVGAFLGFVVYFIFGKEVLFFPEVDPSDAVISIDAPPGTPLDETDTIVRHVEQRIPLVPASLEHYQATTGQSTGRFSAGSENNQGLIRLAFVPFNRRRIEATRSIDSLRNRTDSIPGAEIRVERIETGPPAGHDISYRVVGNQYDSIGIIAESIQRILSAYPQFRLVDSDFERAQPEIPVTIDRKRAAFYELSTRDIASTIRSALTGTQIGTFRKEDIEHDIVVRYADQYRHSFMDLTNLQIINRSDHRIPLSSVASIQRQSSVGVIKHHNLKQAVEIWADFRENAQRRSQITRQIQQRIDAIAIPEGYTIEKGESEEMRTESTRFLQQAFVIALFLIFIVLITLFDSYMQPFIILISVVLSLGGVMWGYTLIGQPFVIIMSGVGVIALAGVVVNNAIVLIDYVHILLERGYHWPEAIITSGKIRLRPVLLTAITTVLGIIPMALGISIDFHNFSVQIGSESSQLWKPFAWAMIFGLTFATIMTLVVIPALLAINYRFAPPDRDRPQTDVQ